MALAITDGQHGDAPAALGLLNQRPPSLTLTAARLGSNALREFLPSRGTTPVIPNNPIRKHHRRSRRDLYRRRNVIERVFCRLKDFRRIATRYDRPPSPTTPHAASPPPSSGGYESRA